MPHQGMGCDSTDDIWFFHPLGFPDLKQYVFLLSYVKGTMLVSPLPGEMEQRITKAMASFTMYTMTEV
jgi:hypothetical protein